jgi:hypothetical protein
MKRLPHEEAQPLILANSGASLDLVDRVRDAILHGYYSEQASDGPLAVDRPVQLSISGIRRSMMAMRERALRHRLTAAFVTRALPPLARDPLPHERYAHVAWTADLCQYPQWRPLSPDFATEDVDESIAAARAMGPLPWPDERVQLASLFNGRAFPFDSLAVARAAFAAPMLPKGAYSRLVDSLWGIASFAIGDPGLPDSLTIGCSASTPWSPPSLVATDMSPTDLFEEREKAISMPSLSFPPTSLGTVPLEPDVAALIPTVLQVSERHDDKGSRLVLSPMTCAVRRCNAIDPMAVMRILDELRRNPIHLSATATGRPGRMETEEGS